MADNTSKRGASDRGLIALSEPYEVGYWSKKFKVTPAKLRYAVKKVGHSAKKSTPISGSNSTTPATGR